MTLRYTFNDLLNLFPSRRIKKEKERVRERILQRRRIMSREDVQQRSEKIRQQIEQTDIFQQAQHIMLYYPIRHEVDLLQLVDHYADTKHFYLPVVHRASIEVKPFAPKQELHRGKFGIPEPQGKAYKGPIDLIIIPAVAFDHLKHRLGRGGGYYDRFLNKNNKAKKMGVGYDYQLIDTTLPHNFRDKNMDIIVTETNIIK